MPTVRLNQFLLNKKRKINCKAVRVMKNQPYLTSIIDGVVSALCSGLFTLGERALDDHWWAPVSIWT
jgi:hypothetical protein